MIQLKRFRQLVSVGILLTGFLFVISLPSHIQIKCSKLEVKQNKFCTYGIGMFPSLSRTNCFMTEINSVVCETINYSLYPKLKSSFLLVDPTGSYTGKSNVFSNSKSAPRPNLVLVNYRKKTQIPIPNYSFRDQNEINLLKKDFDTFLKNPNKKTYQIDEEIPGTWILVVPFGGIVVLVSVIVFQGKPLKNKVEKLRNP
jgi:hypothetical protein